jgi:hypothetical protein
MLMAPSHICTNDGNLTTTNGVICETLCDRENLGVQSPMPFVQSRGVCRGAIPPSSAQAVCLIEKE